MLATRLTRFPVTSHLRRNLASQLRIRATRTRVDTSCSASYVFFSFPDPTPQGERQHKTRASPIIYTSEQHYDINLDYDKVNIITNEARVST